MDAIGVLPAFKGIMVHDCWSPYFGYACEHAVCNAHILRDLKGISEDTGQRWSDEMHDLLLEIYAAVDGAPESAGSLTPVEIEEFQRRFCSDPREREGREPLLSSAGSRRET